MSLLEARNLTLHFPGKEKPLFENQSLSLEKGERVTLTGPSGKGKTLFLRSLCLLEPHTQGTILFQGQHVSPLNIPLYRSQVMYLGQRGVFPKGTVESAFLEAFHLKVHRNKIWDRNQTGEALSLLGKPQDFLSRDIQSLSGGEKQIIQILRAIALNPLVLCLDEPTSALDPASVLKIENWLNFHFSGAWIWVTHQQEQAQRVGRELKGL